ncbi:TetR/AcrR family transcriptional regulator [Streptomyces radicis]|uniref:TetR/AcrR family transcriptional regulator n=1 Tax=Streptomyces radicis TaxID=1750517 RepID=A0A3A9WBR2_9ACTN|nr:TetR/AcrR family transcriptional regulator [Streptomyces radicis]RKN09763.1 TetR/AcrR family transcriptional regulator [Streptomyces radicis]RKN23400.1 TetR/AcrR family transcriptional regulator [Streptomyces radicis]
MPEQRTGRSTAQAPNRFERRRAATRRALVDAARRILAERGAGDISIQRIAERADVGFGSFYNHFSSKAELFNAAVAEALDDYGGELDAVVGSLSDPAERFAASVRLTIAMVESHPELMRVLRHSGLGQVPRGDGLAPRVLRDIERGVDAGRFAVDDPAVALAAACGALLGLVDLRLRDPAGAGPGDGERMAALLLRMLGVPPDEAAELSRRPLPAPAGR